MRAPALILCAAMLLISHAALAQEGSQRKRAAELTLSNDTLQVRYLTSGEKLNMQNSQLSAAFFVSEERDFVGMLDLLVPADLDLDRFSVRLGPRAYAALLEEENNDVLTLAIGAEVRFDLLRGQELAIVGTAFYAPDILTFGSADRLTDFTATVEMRLMPKLVGFAGMRWWELELLDDQERTLQDEIVAGIRWEFE